MTMQHYKECIEAGLDKRTASQFAAFQDIAQMFREERAKPKEQRKQEWMERLEKDFDKFRTLGPTLAIGFSRRFSSNQFVRVKKQKDSKIFIIAGETGWQSPDETPIVPQFKIGKKIAMFDNVQALTDFLWDN